ncbi:MAG TPA: FAD-dependent oxidoreductase [Thermoanaerobaculia bacterium]|nr:FAD-dependent oxidoreductase [Thermoanaerobaculia bacterium]
MIRVTAIRLPLDHGGEALAAATAHRLGVRIDEIAALRVAKRSADARRRSRIQLVYTVDVETPREGEVLARLAGDARVAPTPDTAYRPVARALAAVEPRPVVVGAGPCGLFAALVLAEAGLRPLVLERGKQVRERTVDTFAFWRRRELDPESNVQFGEGGAGTFSDGKLYSQVRDPKHHGRKVLTELVTAGAPEEILWEGRPHVGTFRLVKVVEGLRAKIESLGGEIRFRSRVDGLSLEAGRLRGLRLAGGAELRADHVVLAVGHSARDTFEMLQGAGVRIVPKPFSIGFRVEHPQAMIDDCRYGRSAGHPRLGAADYRFSHHCRGAGLAGRTVYSFCMCPGGTVVAAASEPGGVVTNGMSQYDRAERNANAGLVVDIRPERDYPGGPLAGLELQRALESRAFVLGGSTYDAPAQLVGDLLEGRASTTLGSVIPSYRPGVRLCDLRECVPELVIDALREALPAFERQMRGFARPDAVLTGVESRTSSPIRIPRDEGLQSESTPGLFPAGEGAGYAGGILSAAIDGIRVAEAVALDLASAGRAARLATISRPGSLRAEIPR